MPRRLAALCLLLTLAVPLSAATPREQAEGLVADSRRAAAAGRLDDALDLARRATALDPQLAPAYAAVGAWCERKGLREESVDAYARAARLDDTPEARAALARVLDAGPFPESLAKSTPDALPGRRQTLSLSWTDPRLADQRGPASCLLYTPVAPRPADATRDARYGASYPAALYLLTLPPGGRRWSLAGRVHFQPGREALAWRCGEIAAALLLTGPTCLGPAWNLRQPLDLWLTEEGRPGAEGWPGTIYLVNVGTPRQDTEWVRQLAHEMGHVAVRGGIGGLAGSETWANGELGELLFVQWLLRARDANGAALPWLTPALERWHANRVRQWSDALAASGGPAGITKPGDDQSHRAAAFCYQLAELFGPAVLAESLVNAPQPVAASVTAAAQAAVARRLAAGLPVWPGEGWVYLPGRVVVTGGVTVDGQALTPGDGVARRPGWYRLQVTASSQLRSKL